MARAKSRDIEILPPEDSLPMMEWPATLAAEIIVAKMDPKIPCAKYGIKKERYLEFERDPRFQAQLEESSEAFRKSPESLFKATAKLYSIDALDVLKKTSQDGSNPARDRVESAKSIIKMAGFDESANKAAAAVVPGLTINIDLS